MFIFNILNLLFLILFLSSCDHSADKHNRSIGQRLDHTIERLAPIKTDAEIEAAVYKSWENHHQSLIKDLSFVVKDGRVLVVGITTSPKHHIDAIRLVWGIPGVKEVIDTAQVRKHTPGLMNFAADAITTTRIKSSLLAMKHIGSTRYAVITLEGVAYVLGTATSNKEMQRVINCIRTTQGVKRLRSYIRVKH